MYGYRQANENGLMTNLNSISSSLSSIDTIGRRNTTKASADNLITLRGNSTTSTSLLWRNSSNDDRYSTATSVRNGVGSRGQGSEIYYNGERPLKSHCPSSSGALNSLLIPLLLLTITREAFDFLGQIWLQILINFFTILSIIFALFGIKQNRISYLVLFTLWSLFNICWNLFIICIHLKLRDLAAAEDILSLYTGATSWWHTNGPGCLPYNISSIQPSITILKPNIITGCKLDYHLVESTQAALHACMSLIAVIVSCCVCASIRRSPAYFFKKQPRTDKLLRLNNLSNDRSKINHNPYPNNEISRSGSNVVSLRRPANKTSSRSSQHSMRSARRRHRQSVDGSLQTPRGSTSSAQRSHKYGSLSSRRSHRKDRRGDIASLTYGAAGEKVAAYQRTRLSSLSSAEYLPSYQPPHSSSANLLSTYGEISSIDSCNNGTRTGSSKQRSTNGTSKGASNPTYNGSRSSVCSHSANANNYDDLSYIYGSNNIASRPSESLYGASSSNANQLKVRSNRNGYASRDVQQPGPSQEIKVETHLQKNGIQHNEVSSTRAKVSANNGTSFQSFSATGQHSLSRLKIKGPTEVNNNTMTPSYQNTYDHNGPSSSNDNYSNSGQIIYSVDNQLGADVTVLSNPQVYSDQRTFRHPIYSHHPQSDKSETPI